MEHRNLGRTGVQVSPLCLGAMMFGAWGNRDHGESIRIVHTALEAGVNFVDTADVYSRGESEEIVGKALRSRRDGVVLATKVHGSMGEDPNQRGNSRRWITRAVEDSLRRLDTDWIDLYQIHRPEPDTDVDETLGALSDLVRQGKIRYFGSSTFPAHEIVEAQWVAERRGRERFVCEQPPYSLLARGVERDVLPVCQRYAMGVIPWSPLAGGWLSGRWRTGGDAPGSTRAERLPRRYDLSLPENQRKLDAADALARLAEEAGLQPDPPRDRVRARAPCGDRRDHRPADAAPAREPARRRRRDARRRAPRPDRRDRSPGTNLNPADAGYTPPSLEDATLRRRSP